MNFNSSQSEAFIQGESEGYMAHCIPIKQNGYYYTYFVVNNVAYFSSGIMKSKTIYSLI